LIGNIAISHNWLNLLELQIKHLSRGHHRNVVTLIGYCKDEAHLGLVYEFMAGGNLEQRLRGREAPLTWSQRLKIAVDSASGNYMHAIYDIFF
jgi:serine/threonine protein kinase